VDRQHRPTRNERCCVAQRANLPDVSGIGTPVASDQLSGGFVANDGIAVPCTDSTADGPDQSNGVDVLLVYLADSNHTSPERLHGTNDYMNSNQKKVRRSRAFIHLEVRARVEPPWTDFNPLNNRFATAALPVGLATRP
jgi:hypothetical protein